MPMMSLRPVISTRIASRANPDPSAQPSTSLVGSIAVSLARHSPVPMVIVP
jgi:hypothetical protein